jgi:hypothetical protein
MGAAQHGAKLGITSSCGVQSLAKGDRSRVAHARAQLHRALSAAPHQQSQQHHTLWQLHAVVLGVPDARRQHEIALG